jgi:hypothetical protein
MKTTLPPRLVAARKVFIGKGLPKRLRRRPKLDNRSWRLLSLLPGFFHAAGTWLAERTATY